MHKIKTKLHSNRGSSILIALSLVLICTMVSSAIITAAASGSGRNKERTETQRAYLAVSSAAELLMEELEQIGTYKGVRTAYTYGCSQYITGTETQYPADGLVSGAESAFITTENKTNVLNAEERTCPLGETELRTTSNETDLHDGILGKLVKAGAESIYTNVGAVDYEKKFTMKVDGEDRLPEVAGIFTMFANSSDKYTIVITLSAPNAYGITITAEAKEETDLTPTETSKVLCSHMVNYTILKNGVFEPADPKEVELTGIEKIYHTTINWDKPVMKKGV